MSYAVEADLNLSASRLVELTENDDAVGVKDDALIARLLLQTVAEIDDALDGRYVVPFTTVPSAVKYICADIWRLRIYEHREVMETPSSVLKAAEKSRAILKAYQLGEDMLNAVRVTAATGPANTAGVFNSDPAEVEPNERVFGRSRDGL